jgi:hypothetical protein
MEERKSEFYKTDPVGIFDEGNTLITLTPGACTIKLFTAVIVAVS